MISLLATEVVVVLYRQCSLEKKNDREYIFYFIDKEKYPMIARMANENSSKVYYILPGRSGKKKKKSSTMILNLIFHIKKGISNDLIRCD